MKPVIAIPQLGPGIPRLYTKYIFSTVLRRAGAEILWLDSAHPKNAAQQALCCDGLIIPGGDDIHPSFYGQEKSEKCGKQNKLRDGVDPVVMKAFLETGKPVLGICRGMQMMNVVLGGTLHQDIKDIQKINHRDKATKTTGTHPAAILENTLLREILGQQEVTVNTLHHQAVDRIGTGLAVAAHSSDGIVEAVELAGHKFCLGLQWHPEYMAKNDAKQMKIIEAFVKACK